MLLRDRSGIIFWLGLNGVPQKDSGEYRGVRPDLEEWQ